MQKKFGFKAELKKILTMATMFHKVFADEGGEGGQQQINYEQLIATARKEEKDKLYPQITKLKEEKESLTTKLNDSLLAYAELKKKYDTISAEGANIDEVTKELTTTKAKLEAITEENKKLKEQVENAPKEDDIRASIAKEYEVKDYIKAKLEENKKLILSVFASDVKGATKEEVDASLKEALEKSASIRKDLGIKEPSADEENDPKKKAKPSKPKNSVPASGASVETIDIDYVRGLDPRSPEYKEFRKKLGLK